VSWTLTALFQAKLLWFIEQLMLDLDSEFFFLQCVYQAGLALLLQLFAGSDPIRDNVFHLLLFLLYVIILAWMRGCSSKKNVCFDNEGRAEAIV
jgi:hypothetical protein